ncbi:MAG: hypothetical protein MJZ05_11860 [Fibrobacter sp.]|nr:hypothetical protein [Fibrobacter sp.]
MLSEVDLTTLEEIPEAYNEVQERGEADVAFKVKSNSGEEVFFDIPLSQVLELQQELQNASL